MELHGTEAVHMGIDGNARRVTAALTQIRLGSGPAGIAARHGISAAHNQEGKLWDTWHDTPEAPDQLGYPIVTASAENTLPEEPADLLEVGIRIIEEGGQVDPICVKLLGTISIGPPPAFAEAGV